MTTVIEVLPEGVATSLHSDNFPLDYLGSMGVKRATDIVYNSATLLWEVYYLDEPSTGGRPHKSKNTAPCPVIFNTMRVFSGCEQARQAEVAWLNGCREVGIHPLSEEGVKAATAASLSILGEDTLSERVKAVSAKAPSLKYAKQLRRA